MKETQSTSAIGSFLSMNREVPALLNLSLSVNHLVDVDYCRTLSDSLRRTSARWERSIATSNLGNMLPSNPGLYMFVWCPEFFFELANPENSQNLYYVIYVGRALSGTTIRARYNSEYSRYIQSDFGSLWDNIDQKTREQRLKKHLSLMPLEFWYLPLSLDDGGICLLEKRMIKLLNPPANSDGTVKARRGGKPEDIWRG
jgi:hypothetical protein